MLFLATLLITVACCLLLGIGLLLGGRPLRGGCGQELPESARCAACPNRGRHEPGQCPKRGDQ